MQFVSEIDVSLVRSAFHAAAFMANRFAMLNCAIGIIGLVRHPYSGEHCVEVPIALPSAFGADKNFSHFFILDSSGTTKPNDDDPRSTAGQRPN